MPSREERGPARMARVAIVAPETRWRRVLAEVADSGVVEPVHAVDAARPGGDAAAELDRVTASSAARDGVRAIVAWTPVVALSHLEERLDPLGGAVAELEVPPGEQPPTLLPTGGRAERVRPLVETYGIVPYRDIDPTWFAVAAYVLMFGMMFGDVGHGALLAIGGCWLLVTSAPSVQGIRRMGGLVVALGVVAAVFGLLYGECFGPTGLVPALWMRPLDEPVRLLAAGLVVGAGLMGIAYGIGVVNRWREGGPGVALYAPSGVAGAALFVALGLVAGGLFWGRAGLWATGLVLAVVALVLVAVGLKANAGSGAAGTLQASVEVFDVVIRLGSNVASFARLAAFGLTHAALGQVVWDATTALWAPGVAAIAAIAVFVVGNLVAFALEALVAGVQALRLEYYELFSRVFAGEGRPFRPWLVPLSDSQEET